MKIVFIDRSAKVRAAICGLLMDELNVEVQWVSYETPLSNDDVVMLGNADFIVLDLTNVKKSARLFIAEIREAFSKPKLIVLHFYTEMSFVKPLLGAGANAYLLIDNSRNELPLAIKAIQNGRQFISPEVH